MARIEVPVQIKNEYCIKLIDAKTGKVKQEVVAHNVVTDLFYDHLFKTGQIGYVKVGIGNGVPATTDTSLFEWKATKVVSFSEIHTGLADNVNAGVYSCVFTENEANGNLTELGLSPDSSNNGNYIWTHSRFTDAEDQPISIVKTEYDKLSITATIYSTVLQSSGPFRAIRYVSFENQIVDLNAPQPPFTGNQIQYGGFVLATLGRQGIGNNIAVKYELTRSGTGPYAGWVKGIDPGNVSVSTVTGGYTRLNVPRVTADQQNGTTTLQVKAISLRGGSQKPRYTDVGGKPIAAFLNFPNHDVFPPKTLEFEKVGTGSQTDYNLGIPVLMDEVQVYVDGVLQDPSTYDWNGRDFNCAQAWLNADGDDLDQENLDLRFYTDSYSSYTAFPVCIALRAEKYYSYSNPYGGGKLYSIGWDFKQPVTVSHFKSYYNIYAGRDLEYSDDKETWTTAYTFVNTSVAIDVSFGPVTARYWRVRGLNGKLINEEQTPGKIVGALGDPKPQLHFHTAPAAEAAIKIIAKTEYPIKNSNWLIDNCIIDFKATRGDS